MTLRFALACVLVLAPACGASEAAPATERLWLSNLPGDARGATTGFLTLRGANDRYFGTFYHGSLLRGAHDAFSWDPRGKDRATLTFLQDGSSRDVQFSSCKPASGFDMCLIVRGGPYGVERYQSRKRWVVGRRKGKKEMSGVMDALAELAETDDDLAAALAVP